MLIYKTFEGSKPPTGTGLARSIKKGHTNVCCMNVDNPASYRSKGWAQTMDGAVKGEVEEIEVEVEEEVEEDDDSD